MGELKGLAAGEWKKTCDYLVIGQQDVRALALFVELKKTLHDTAQRTGLEQLRRSLPLLDYLRSVCAIECGQDAARIEVRYVLLAEKGSPRLDKQPVRPLGRPQVVEHAGIKVALHIIGSRAGFARLWQQ